MRKFVFNVIKYAVSIPQSVQLTEDVDKVADKLNASFNSTIGTINSFKKKRTRRLELVSIPQSVQLTVNLLIFISMSKFVSIPQSVQLTVLLINILILSNRVSIPQSVQLTESLFPS